MAHDVLTVSVPRVMCMNGTLPKSFADIEQVQLGEQLEFTSFLEPLSPAIEAPKQTHRLKIKGETVAGHLIWKL